MAKEEFTGFANAPVDEDGKYLDFREVDAFVDESDEGKALRERQTTPSSIAAFHTDDKSTDGAPAAVVPDNVKAEADAAEAEAKAKSDTPKTAKAAEGKEAKQA
jgi:hypothetical protein